MIPPRIDRAAGEPAWVPPLVTRPIGTRAVYLDRDGVLNEVAGDGLASRPPRMVEDLRIVAGAEAAIERLRRAGFSLIVVTNQPDVARGTLALDDAVEITKVIVDRLELDGAYVCPHDNPDRCPCRKPKPGMLDRAARDWGIDQTASWLIGDRWVDIAAGLGAGVRTVLIEQPFSWSSAGGSTPPDGLVPEFSVPSISDAAEMVLAAKQ
jgi:D-glycero-D-manno-heptose 1,7-bisphosphate phosphatase